MPSAAWIAAAKRSDRQQVLLMGVESISAIRSAVTTQADWTASKSLTHCNLTTEPGTVIAATDGVEPVAGTYAPLTPINFSAAYLHSPYVPGDGGDPVPEVTTPAVINLSTPSSHTVHIVLNIRNVKGAFGSDPVPLTMELSLNGGAYYLYSTLSVGGGALSTDAYTISTSELPQGHYDIRLTVDPTSIYTLTGTLVVDSAIYTHETHYLASSLQTRNIDLEVIPTVPSMLQVDAYVPVGCTLAMTARGSNDASTWTSLGTVADGSALAPYRYYDVTAAMTSTGPNTVELYEIRIIGGDSQYTYLGTHEDIPMRGVRPLLVNSLGSITSKLELMKLGSIGEVSPKMFYVKETFELLRDGYLRDKAITIKLGFKGMSEADYEPIFAGFWYDGTINLPAGTVDIKTRTLFSRFSKAQVPVEKGGVRSASTVQPKIFSRVNMVAAMLDLISYCGLPARFVDTASANAIMAGPRAGEDWLIDRTLDKDSKEDALKLIEELSVLSGVSVIQQPDGKIYFDLYDPEADAVAEITSDIATIGSVEMGQASLYTRQQIYYDPKHEGDLTTGIVWGSWAAGMNYAAGDSLPTQRELTWHALTTHTSIADSQPGLGIGWRSAWAPSWQSGQSYYNGDKVWLANKIYTASADHTSSTSNIPGVGSVWGAGITLALATVYGLWASGLSLSRNASIIDSGTVWFCLQDHTTSSTNRPATGADCRAFWTTDWATATAYLPGDVRMSGGPLYTCRFAHTSAAGNEPGRGAYWRDFWSTQPVKANDSADGYYSVYQLINEAAEIAWGLNADVQPNDPDYLKNPGFIKQFFDKWNASPVALAALAARMDGLFANPKMKLKASDLPPQFAGVRLGQTVALTGSRGNGRPLLVLPTAGAEWGVPVTEKKFRVMATALNEAKGTVNFDLLEV